MVNSQNNLSEHYAHTHSRPRAGNVREAPQTVWLDHLPQNVCIQIHSSLPQYKLTNDPYAAYQSIHSPDYSRHLSTLELAAVSSFQREAAALAQNHTLHAEYINSFDHATYLFSAWHGVLGNHIREIRLSNFIDYSPDDALHKILSLPTINKATIPNHPVLFTSLVTGRSLRSLQVELSIQCHKPDDGSPSLAHVIEACPIEHIYFKCDTCIRKCGDCYAALCFKALNNSAKCDTVRSVHVECDDRRLERLAESAFVFPALEKLTLQRSVAGAESMLLDDPHPPYCITVGASLEQKLQTLRSVNLIHCGSVSKFAPMLRHNLTTIITKTHVSSEDVKALESCPNLQEIEICFQEGADRHFPENLRALKSVTLGWRYDDEDGRPGEGYLTPAPGLLTGLVARNSLEEFQIQHAYISDGLRDELLRRLGGRLRKLRLPLGRGPPAHVKRTLRLVMQHNLNVTELTFGSHDSEQYTRVASDVHENNGFCDPDWCEICNKCDKDDCSCECYCPECGCQDCGCECACEYVCQKSDKIDAICRVVKRRLPQLSIDTNNRLRWMFGVAEKVKEAKKECSMQ